MKIGDKVGMLTLLQKKREKNRTYYYCRCDCGTEKWIRADTIGKSTISCGCYNKKNNSLKPKDLTNKTFGYLKAIKPTESKVSNGSIIWECVCKCGNICYIAASDLTRGRVRSCGCLVKEKTMDKATEQHLKKNIVDHTNVPVITRKTLQSNNTSGVTGVRWDSTRNKWIAVITFKKKVYYLGRYTKKEDAIKARKKAEKELFGPFLEWYNKNIKKLEE